MRIFHSPYELKPKRSLSSRASAEARAGALLKIEHEEWGSGYADIHPWPELGDAPLSEQLSLLAAGMLTPLTRNTLVFAQLDAKARAEKRWLWKDLEIPESHYLAVDFVDLLSGQREAILEQGFRRIKIKCGRDPLAEARLINDITRLLAGRAKLRLDFNSALSPEAWSDFSEALTVETLMAIDFIEDPTPWTSDAGFGSNPRSISLAVDRNAEELMTVAQAQVMVIKPAVADVDNLLRISRGTGARAVFTSYLDHPLGQLWAAWSAAYHQGPLVAHQGAAAREICGLVSQDAYHPTPFHELLLAKGPRLAPPSGPGIGWGEELERLCGWRELG